MNDILKLLETLVAIPSPTGMTKELEEYLLSFAEENSIPASRSHKGTIVFTLKGKNSSELPLILSSHIDTLGAMVKEVNEKEVCIYPLGSYPAMYALGNYCTIHADTGVFAGTILPKNPAVHVNAGLRDIHLKFDDLSIRVDLIPEKTKTLSDYIARGDFVTLDPAFSVENGYIKSRHLDDKAATAILLKVAKELAETVPIRDTYFVFNITEETGQGVSAVPQHGDFLVVDMGVVGDGCSGKETHVSICVKDGSGPYNHDFTKELKQLAERENLDFTVDIFPFYSSDGSSVLSSGKDYRVALIGPGVSASHGWERTHTRALENTFKLIQAFLLK